MRNVARMNMGKNLYMAIVLAACGPGGGLLAAAALGADETRPAVSAVVAPVPASSAPVVSAPVVSAPVASAPAAPAAASPAAALLVPVSPAPLPLEQPMPPAYNVLLERSIFAKDSHAAAAPHAASSSHSGDSAIAAAASGSDGDFILRGVGVSDGRPTAFFEQASEHRVFVVHLGDPLLHGVISAGTLDGVDYVVGGKAMHVTIGQRLDGGVAVAEAATQPASDSTSKWISHHHVAE